MKSEMSQYSQSRAPSSLVSVEAWCKVRLWPSSWAYTSTSSQVLIQAWLGLPPMVPKPAQPHVPALGSTYILRVYRLSLTFLGRADSAASAQPQGSQASVLK